MRNQNDITRDIVTILIFLSTTFFSKITDTLGDYARFKMKLRSSKKVPGKDSPDTTQNEHILVPSFISALIQEYRETCQDELAKKPSSDAQIKRQVKRDLRGVLQSMIEGVVSNLYRDNNNKTQNSEPEGEVELPTATKDGTRNNASTPHFIGSMPSSDLRTSSQSGHVDLMQAALKEREAAAEAY